MVELRWRTPESGREDKTDCRMDYKESNSTNCVENTLEIVEYRSAKVRFMPLSRTSDEDLTSQRTSQRRQLTLLCFLLGTPSTWTSIALAKRLRAKLSTIAFCLPLV